MNAPYSKLELALDGMYKVILLLKKKKYAAIKLEPDQNGTPFVREVPPPASPRRPGTLPHCNHHSLNSGGCSIALAPHEA